MIDYHAPQMTGSACQGRNCAAASGAMAVYQGSGGRVQLTADRFRADSHVSCIPGNATPSGGLFISNVIDVAHQHGVAIDYGRTAGGYTRWPSSVAKSRLSTGWGGVFLGDYDQVRAPYRAPSSGFLGDHSAFAHDYRTDLPAYANPTAGPVPTVCWHDPLRKAPIRLPLTQLLRYWQKPGSPVKGLAGFVRIPAVATLWGSDVPANIRVVDPLGKKVGAAVRKAGRDYKTVVNMGDLEKALENAHINYKTAVNPIDVKSLLDWAAKR